MLFGMKDGRTDSPEPTPHSERPLPAFEPRFNALVALDSDGCVLDTMEAKQRLCFHGEIARQWGLEEIEPDVRRVGEYVNLYSKWRGQHRFPALLQIFDLLPTLESITSSGLPLPDTRSLRKYVESGVPLSHETLEAACERTGDPALYRVLAWSRTVNQKVEGIADLILPFEGVPETLDGMHRCADLMVVTQTPTAAVAREWKAHGLDRFVRFMAGPEFGSKAQSLRAAGSGRYPPGRLLMVGDAPGDLQAARAVGAHFFPIVPGQEAQSWRRLRDEAFDLFIAGAYDEHYQSERIAEFEAALPDTPPWQTAS
jgi:phosphoglycolate phosphatase-like HAD superfamily hydrolase